MFLGASYFLFQGQRGGWNIPTFLELFCFLWFAPYYSDSIMTIQKN